MSETNSALTPFSACIEIFTHPSRVFQQLKSTDNWSWLPFILVSIATLLPAYLYFSQVDFNWFMDQMINADYGDVSPAEQDQARSFMTAGRLQISSVLMGGLWLLVANAILALYLNLITRMDEDNVQGFTDWYGFAWWVSMPALVSGVAGIIAILIAGGGEMSMATPDPLSLAFIFGLEYGNQWFSLLSNVGLTQIWAVYLTAVGVSQWTNLPSNKVYLIAIGPFTVLLAVNGLSLLI